MPKLSVITINFNNRKGLKKTIASVINQTFSDFEYIIIDGGSTDGSTEEIKQVADKLVYWVSEPDKGVYHAMNKGIKKATGEYCLFLNSGDCLVDNEVLSNLFQGDTHQEDILYSDAYFGNFRYNYSIPINLEFLLTKSLCHQSTLIKKHLFNKYGLYNENYRIYSDWEFLLKIILIENCSYKYLDYVCIAKIENGGISQQRKNEKARNIEKLDILNQNIKRVISKRLDEDKFLNEIADLLIRYTEFKDSKLIKFALAIEKSRLFFALKRFYFSIKN